jgi:hypothetical protein
VGELTLRVFRGSLFQEEFDFELFFALSLVLPLFVPLVGFVASSSRRRS